MSEYSGYMAVKQPPEPKAVPLLKDAVRAYAEACGSTFTASEVASVVGADPVVTYETIKDLVRCGHVKFVAPDGYPKGTKFPFTTPTDRCTKTLFIFDPQ